MTINRRLLDRWKRPNGASHSEEDSKVGYSDSFSRRYRKPVQRTILEDMLRGSARLRAKSAAGWILGAWAGLIALDEVTGPYYSFTSFYLVTLCLTTWCLGRIAGLASGAVTIAVTIYINGPGDELSAQSSLVPAIAAAWNTAMRGLGVVFLILLVSAFRRTFDQEYANALIDPLTGLGNRRSFQRDCKRQELLAIRDSRILLCGVIDLDDFKAVNDRHGHASGDAVLCVFAKALGTAVRPYDVTARLGGDEFAFCLMVRDEVEGSLKADQIYQALMAALQSSTWQSTCSLGAATGTNFEQTIRLADQTMYEAKASGKNTFRYLKTDDTIVLKARSRLLGFQSATD